MEKLSPAMRSRNKRNNKVVEMFETLKDKYEGNVTQLYYNIADKVGISYATVIRVLQRNNMI